MKRVLLKDFRPGPMDTPAYVEGRGDWTVTDAICRGATACQQAAFQRKAKTRGAEIHRLSHWATGWIEVALIPPKAERKP